MNMKPYYQQGDVLLFKVNATELKREREAMYNPVKYTRTNVLQHGEATGHAHRIASPGFQIFESTQWNGSTLKYLNLKTVGLLSHEEHKPIKLPKGVYKIEIVREYDHFQKVVRKVRD